jgi:dTDP-4-dehydrorhamnose reductase
MTGPLILGGEGMLGRALGRTLGPHARLVGRSEVDITKKSDLEDFILSGDTVINTAAFTRVDDAQTQREEAFAINAWGVKNLAEVAKDKGARVIHISTDYVFDGQSQTPYSESHPTHPQSVYGHSKAAGEEFLREILPESSIIMRTAWLYASPGSNFARTILRAGLEREFLDVVDDQVGQPTWAGDVVRMIMLLLEKEALTGIFHATNSGQTSWFGFAQALFTKAGWDEKRIRPARTENFPRPAPRPAHSVLGHEAWMREFQWAPRSWSDALDEAWEKELHQIVETDRG